LILLGITGQEAKAELFNLNSSNTNFGIAAPFATVNQIETGLPSGVSVRFVVSVSASAAAAGGTLGEFALNIASANVTNATLVSFSSTPTTASPYTLTKNQPNSVSSAGHFNLDLSAGNESNANRYTTATYDFSGFTSANLVPNENGNLFVVHLFLPNVTGFAFGGTVVPEPSSLAIAGLGALGFVGYGLRRRPKK